MKISFLLPVWLVFLTINLHAQIHSTTAGGYWNDPGTWVGAVIPGSSNDVVIDGPVILATASGYTILSEYCKNLTITAVGTLKNGDYGGGSGIYPLVVSGNVTNYGMVANGPSDALKILISGDLENNNIWMPYQTEFQNSDNHNLNLAPGKTFGSRIVNNGASTITALSDLVFTCDFMGDGNLNRENFYLNGKTLVLGNHSIELRKCLINNGTLTGDFHIKGNFKVDMYSSDTMVFIGNITVDDTLTCNPYNGGYAIEKLKISGDITNNGVISDNDGDNPDDLSLLITGNIVNNGTWNCNFINFTGTETQYVSQSSGKQFDSYLTDLNPASKVQALTNITIAKDFNLNGTTLEMEGHKLTIGGWLYHGFINNTTLHNGFLQNITSLNDLTLEGLVTVETGNIFQKSVVVTDTLQSKEYGGGSIVYTLTIDGNIQNNGVIKNISPDDQLSLEIWGNIENNGEWLHGFTKFSGFRAHHISALAGHIFNGQFSVLNSIGSITANSDVEFSGDFDLGKMMMDMQNNSLTFRTDKWLYNGELKNARLRNGMLSSLRLTGNTEISGYVQLADGNDAVGNVTVNDTLTVIAYGGGSAGYTFVVHGNVVNKGFLGQMYDDGIYIKVNGNIINEGIWNAWQNYFLFYSNINTCSLTCTNTGIADLQVNSSDVTGPQANAFPIISGGGMQTIPQNQSYSLTIQLTPTDQDATAHLALACVQVGTLNSIDLIGYSYETEFVGIRNNVPVSNSVILKQNYPNPFAESTTINWQLPQTAHVVLKIYDFAGREVKTLVDCEQVRGEHKADFNAASLPAGVYFYQLRINGIMETKKMICFK